MNNPFQMWANKVVVYLPNLIFTFVQESQGEGGGGEQNDVRYFSKGIFSSGKFPMLFSKRQFTKCTISQESTYQVCPSRSAQHPSLL